MGTWAEHADEVLRRAGHRSGGARTAVVDLLASQSCCQTAQELHDLLRARNRRVGLASVYRALDVLANLDLITRIEVGDATTRFEPRHPDGDHHHHVVCTDCGAVSAFEDDALEQAIGHIAGRLDHVVVDHEVVLRGTCPACQEGR